MQRDECNSGLLASNIDQHVVKMQQNHMKMNVQLKALEKLKPLVPTSALATLVDPP